MNQMSGCAGFICAPQDDALLDRLQHTAFDYFRNNANPANGLMADTTRAGAPSSIAVVGFALSAYPIGVERGWMERADALARTLAALRFFSASDQSGSEHATGYRGFYYHFLDMQSGRRVWRSEVSLIDTALLIAGVLTAAAYFEGQATDEIELRRLAGALYERVDWRWDLYAGPLFIHQYSHAWIDFRGIRDAFMREKRCDYFENSRRATYVQREYARRNPRGFAGYGEDCWGLSAGDGPSAPPRMIDGRHQAFYGYAARGVPYGPDDGTISGPSMLSSLVFAPEVVLPALRSLHGDGSNHDELVQAGGFNATVGEARPNGWVSEGTFGLDQGMIVLMIENYRSGMPWRLGRDNPCIRSGLRRAGFRGGWL